MVIIDKNTPQRNRPVNWKQIFLNISDSYPYGIPHGLQKDAIQNSFDAREGNKAAEVIFRIFKTGKGNFLTFQDINTTGLTGPRLIKESDYEDNLPQHYKWARFEAMGFTKTVDNAIGARGQGKTIFVCSSKDYSMYYDSNTKEEGYRLGGTFTKELQNKIIGDQSWENSKARKELISKTELQPITENGTRIIVVEPKKEVTDFFYKGELEQAIIETWFRPIEKKQLNVKIEINKKIKNINLPSDIFPLPENDSQNIKTWILGNDFSATKIPLQGDHNFKIKNFVAIYFKDKNIPENLRGISIIHNGMKIVSIDQGEWSEEHQNRLFGFIEFEQNLDSELRKGINQNPNHYQLYWNRKIPKAIKDYIKIQLADFGKKKLGLAKDPREIAKNQRTNSENWALRQLHKLGKDLDIFSKIRTKTKEEKEVEDEEDPNEKDVVIRIKDFEFPVSDIAPRINYGQSIRNFKIIVKSKLDTDKEIKLSLSILKGDTVHDVLISNLSRTLKSNEVYESDHFGLDINKSKFNLKGLYRIKANVIDAQSGDILDSYSVKIYVEEDPPFKGLVDLIPTKFEKDHKYHHRQLVPFNDGNKNTVYYNILHPSWKQVEGDDEKQRYYLLDILLHGSLYFVLDRADDDEGNPDFHPLNTKNIFKDEENNSIPKRTHLELMNYYSKFLYKFFS